MEGNRLPYHEGTDGARTSDTTKGTAACTGVTQHNQDQAVEDIRQQPTCGGCVRAEIRDHHSTDALLREATKILCSCGSARQERCGAHDHIHTRMHIRACTATHEYVRLTAHTKPEVNSMHQLDKHSRPVPKDSPATMGTDDVGKLQAVPVLTGCPSLGVGHRHPLASARRP
eukprot:1148413-Pelagomonas_calceolata.AAC.2